jgi:hypothetical protein
MNARMIVLYLLVPAIRRFSSHPQHRYQVTATMSQASPSSESDMSITACATATS